MFAKIVYTVAAKGCPCVQSVRIRAVRGYPALGNTPCSGFTCLRACSAFPTHGDSLAGVGSG